MGWETNVKEVLFAILHLENFEILNHVDDVYSKYIKRIINYFKHVYSFLNTLSRPNEDHQFQFTNEEAWSFNKRNGTAHYCGRVGQKKTDLQTPNPVFSFSNSTI